MLSPCALAVVLAGTPLLGEAAQGRVRNEMVMVPGMTISATTKSGKMVIGAIDEFTRSYTWEGATRSAELTPRHERWYGSLGAYSPGAGDHWRPHNGITRGVLSEGQQHFKTTAQALAWIKHQGWQPYVYRDDGLFVLWGKTPERRQLNIDVVQIYVGGKKPKRLPGSKNSAIVVSTRPAPSPKTSLVEAVRRGDLASVTRLLGSGASPNGRNAVGTPLVVLAASKGHRSVLAAWLERGADPNARSAEEGETALLVASRADVASLLLSKGANANAAYTRGMLEGQSALFGAAMNGDLGLARALLDGGANPNYAAADGKTALYDAASFGSPSVAKLLLERGAAVDARDWLGRTPLMEAASGFGGSPKSSLAIVRLLIDKGANVNARMDAGRLAYGRAQFVGDEAELKRIERAGRLRELREDGPSVLDLARDPEVRKALVSAGAKSAPEALGVRR